MSVWGITMVKDEADVIEDTLRHMLASGVDGLIVADNLSTDETPEIIDSVLEESSIPIVSIMDPEVGYYQSQKMSRLAHMAATQYGATWIIPFDADEVWYVPDDISLGDYMRQSDADVVNCTLLSHVCTNLDPVGPPMQTIHYVSNFVDATPKVAFRWREGAVIQQGNHGVSLPGHSLVDRAQILARHFPIRSLEHFMRKAKNGGAAYAATDLPESMGNHWRSWGAADQRAIESIFYERYYVDLDKVEMWDADLRFDPAPLAHLTSVDVVW